MLRYLCLFALLVLVTSKDLTKKGKTDLQLAQGDCLEGWVDGSSVGLGCLQAEVDAETEYDCDCEYDGETWPGVDQPTAELICNSYGHGGRLVDIYSLDQIEFLQNFITAVETDSAMDDEHSWWIGLNDKAQINLVLGELSVGRLARPCALL